MSAKDWKEREDSLKFLCSYGGKILPRSTDGRLRYVGGLTRVLAVERSIRFSELIVKLAEFCGYSVTLKCTLPNGDLETLISVKTDEDLINVVEEYDRAGSGRKIRAVLSPRRSTKLVSPPSSADASPKSPFSAFASPPSYGRLLCPRCCLPPSPWGFNAGIRSSSGESRCHHGCQALAKPRFFHCGLQSRNYCC